MKTTALATVALLATATLAQAGVIFSDDFNRVPTILLVGPAPRSQVADSR
jgi:hypothetical protein